MGVAGDPLEDQVAVIRRAVPHGGFEARISVVRQAFPCRDDEDLSLCAPRNGPGKWPRDLNGRVAAGGLGELLPVAGGADGATLFEERGPARTAGVRWNIQEPRNGVHAVGLGGAMRLSGLFQLSSP